MADSSVVDAPNSDAHSSARTPEHRTVSRIMAILEVVTASEPNGLRLADLPDMVGAPKSTIHGLARGLLTTGYIREQRGRYYRGPALIMLSGSGDDIPAGYRYALEELSGTYNETAILSTLAGESVINLEKVEPRSNIRASPPLHQRRPMWPGTYGKVFLASMDPRRLDSYLRRKHPDAEVQAAIRAELQTIQETGVAFNRGETDPEMCGVGSPIVIAGMDVTLAIGLAGPTVRMAGRLEELAPVVRAAAQSLSGSGSTRS